MVFSAIMLYRKQQVTFTHAKTVASDSINQSIYVLEFEKIYLYCTM